MPRDPAHPCQIQQSEKNPGTRAGGERLGNSAPAAARRRCTKGLEVGWTRNLVPVIVKVEGDGLKNARKLRSVQVLLDPTVYRHSPEAFGKLHRIQPSFEAAREAHVLEADGKRLFWPKDCADFQNPGNDQQHNTTL